MECRYCHMTNHLILNCPKLNNKKNKNHLETSQQLMSDNNRKSYLISQNKPKFLRTKPIVTDLVIDEIQNCVVEPAPLPQSKYMQALLKPNVVIEKELIEQKQEKFDISKLEFL
jgi:hypothetical protein